MAVVFLAGDFSQPARADDPPAKLPDTVKAAAKEIKESKRRVYVLHSGIHTILANPEKNIAALTLREGLVQRGIHEKNIVVLENPFPTATWKSMFPVDCFKMFAECAFPESKVSQDAYLRLHKALDSRGIGDADDVVWIGHSAGGQMGLTMCYLACHLDKYPSLQATRAYKFDMVICLGSPLCVKQLPDEVKLRHYYSPEDKVLSFVVNHGPNLYRLIGRRVTISAIPRMLPEDAKIRIFRNVEHPYWDVDTRVLDRILGETDSSYRPHWCRQCVTPSAGASLVHLINRALDENYNITLEDLPSGR